MRRCRKTGGQEVMVNDSWMGLKEKEKKANVEERVDGEGNGRTDMQGGGDIRGG